MEQLSSKLPLIACSLDAKDQPARLAEWRELLSGATAHEETPEGVRYTFVADEHGEQRIRDLSAAEHECCPFLEFDVAHRADEVVLTVSAQPDALDALRFVFAG
jgi:hypothetical protein